MIRRMAITLALVFTLIALIGTAAAFHGITGWVLDATDGTPANGHTVIIYYPGDEANYASDLIGPTGSSGTANLYICDAELIPNHVWQVGDEINVTVIDTGDGYTAGPVSVVTTGAGWDLAPNMTLQAPVKVVINELVADNTTEWVELYNKGAQAVDLTGWTLENETGTSKSLAALGAISAGGYAVYSTASDWLNNGGDVAILKDDGDVIIDQVGYGTSGNAPAPDAGKSTGRCPNGQDSDDDAMDFTKLDVLTPGAANACPIDTEPPVTTYDVTPEPNAEGWNNVIPVNVSFFRSDPDSGVAYTNYSTNSSGPWTKVDGGDPFTVPINTEGETTIWYYSVDLNDTPNFETVKSMIVKIDTTDPVIHSIALDTYTPDPNGSIVVTVNATDAGSGVVKVTANGLDLQEQSSPWSGTIYAEFTPGAHTIMVNVTDAAGNMITNDTVQYTVPSVYGVALAPDKTTETIVEGETATYNITVTNTGNTADTINLTVDNGTLSVNPVVALPAQESTIVTLTVQGAQVGTIPSTVTAESQNDSSKTDSVTVTTTVEAKQYGVQLTPEETTATIWVGGTATYTITVNNTGNTADTINLSVNGTGTLNINSVTLAKGGSADVTLTVQGADAGTYPTTIEAVSTNDPNQTDSVTVTTTVERRRLGGGGGGAPSDKDGDGYSDVTELIQGSDPDDPCDPDPNSAACKAKTTPPPPSTPTPTPTPKPTPTPVPTPIATPTATPTPATPTPEEPGFEALFAIAGLLAIAFVVLKLRK